MKIEDLSNHGIVTIAVDNLGGRVDYIEREDIAIAANDIAPGRFNWRKYPERIDLDAIGVALRDAKKQKNGNLLIGNNRDGWMLSPTGLNWIEKHNFGNLHFQQSSKLRRESIAANLQAECNRLKKTRAYLLFINEKSGDISVQDFYNFARINEYFQYKAKQRRYSIIDIAVNEDDILLELWDFLKEKFPEEMK